MTHTRRVWFHRTSALIWLTLIIPALIWWRDSVTFVIVASIYANLKSDWSASEAADDRDVLARLDRIERNLGRPSRGLPRQTVNDKPHQDPMRPMEER